MEIALFGTSKVFAFLRGPETRLWLPTVLDGVLGIRRFRPSGDMANAVERSRARGDSVFAFSSGFRTPDEGVRACALGVSFDNNSMTVTWELLLDRPAQP